jgi:hypothetical protein
VCQADDRPARPAGSHLVDQRVWQRNRPAGRRGGVRPPDPGQPAALRGGPRLPVRAAASGRGRGPVRLHLRRVGLAGARLPGREAPACSPSLQSPAAGAPRRRTAPAPGWSSCAGSACRCTRSAPGWPSRAARRDRRDPHGRHQRIPRGGRGRRPSLFRRARAHADPRSATAPDQGQAGGRAGAGVLEDRCHDDARRPGGDTDRDPAGRDLEPAAR